MNFSDRDMNPKYGIDAYCRYQQTADGERLMIEPYPFFRWHSPLKSLYYKVQARFGVMRWHVGIWQYGGYAKANARAEEEMRRQDEARERESVESYDLLEAEFALDDEYQEAAAGWEGEGGAPLPANLEDHYWLLDFDDYRDPTA